MKYIKEILRGMLIGVANIIPGVSGGTMAVSMGVYDKIIYAVNHLRKEFKKSVMILLPYAIGAVLGIAALSFVIGFLFENYPLQTGLGFVGLILGGVPALFHALLHMNPEADGSKKAKIGIPHYAVLLIFFAGIIALEVLGGGTEREVVLTPGFAETIKLFLIGILASATMVVPGVSGSMILMLLGYYTPIIRTISGFVEAAVHLDIAAAWKEAVILIPFGIGVVLGIFLIAKLIGFLLERFYTFTYMGILGLVFSSPVVVLMQTFSVNVRISGILMGIACLVLGYLVAAYMAREPEQE